MANTETLLNVSDLRTHFDTDVGVARAVDGISFDIKRGECVALVGESGCGKSVTSLTIMRLLATPPARIASGQILFKGRDLLKLTEKQMCDVRGKEIAMIFQEPQSALNPIFAIGDQVSEAYLTHNPKASPEEAWEKAVDSLRQVGIPDPERRAMDYPHQLSGGMKQRVCIAMALICGPELIIADEPTTALDVTIQAQILELLRSLQRQRHLSLLLITHDLGIVAEMAERTCVMYAGKIIECCATAEIYSRPLHPYTQGLLRARPGGMNAVGRASLPAEQKPRLAVIPGIVPAATQFEDNCRFNPRCPLRTSVCLEKEPPLVDYDSDHRAACWHTKAEGIDAWGTTDAATRGRGDAEK
ncbi:MAG TPA: ABC transporter ATP-binding protein [Planctomycetota bacterium]